MNYSAMDYAKYIIGKCHKDHHPVSNLQVQKILYAIQKESIRHGISAFRDRIEAWKFGPAVREVYYYFCGFGAMPILVDFGETLDGLPTEQKKRIDSIATYYSNSKPWEVMNDTPVEDSAWYNVFSDGKGLYMQIPIFLIQAELQKDERRMNSSP